MTETTLDWFALDDVPAAPRNPKGHDIGAILASIQRFGFTQPLLLDERTGRLVAGHGRLEALRWMRSDGGDPPKGIVYDHNGGHWLVPVRRGWASNSDAEAAAYLVADNRLVELGGWDDPLLLAHLQDIYNEDPDLLTLTGFDGDDLDALAAGTAVQDIDTGPRPSLADRFLIPPFDVLDARQGWWQDRKRKWIRLGIKSELGRAARAYTTEHIWTEDRYGKKRQQEPEKGLLFKHAGARDPDYYRFKTAAEEKVGRPLTNAEFEADHYTESGSFVQGTSIFDPVLCELLYRWYTAADYTILDPFAGGSVRGLVAAYLGRRYYGNDLSQPQIEANRVQAHDFAERGLIPGEGVVTWAAGDSQDWVQTLAPDTADFILTCPPYLWLERYSDDPNDLSTMDEAGFEQVYRRILAGAAQALRPDRYAAIVVGDVRDPKTGRLIDFRGMTIAACEAAGLQLLSAAVLVTQVGSLPVRAAPAFAATRVLGRTHQDVLVFCKGDRHTAAEQLGPVEVEWPDAGQDDEEAELDTPAEEISRVIDEGEPVEFGDSIADHIWIDTPDDAPAYGADGWEPVEMTVEEFDAQMAAGEPVDLIVVPRDNTPHLTPLEEHGGHLVKRDDLYCIAGQQGGKVRTCWHLMNGPGAPVGVVTASSRQSPQAMIVAHLARHLGVPCRLHMPTGQETPEMVACRAAGAEIIQHKPGYNTVLIARARTDAKERGWTEIPFGMECGEAVLQTARQVESLIGDTGSLKRIVVPVGSGMSLAGVLRGMRDHEVDLPVLGVQVGADPTKRLDRYAAKGWRDRVELVKSELPYHTHAPHTHLGDLQLDPVYEAKCLPYLRPGDLLWVVGIRAQTTLRSTP